MAVLVRLVHAHVKLGSRNAAALHFFKGNGRAACSERSPSAMADGSAPASASAPTSISPLMPEKASK